MAERARWIFVCAILSFAANAQDVPRGPFVDRPVVDVLEAFSANGWPLAYSSNLVGENLRVKAEPVAEQALAIVREILAPHRLTVRERDDLLLVVRMTKAEIEALAPRVAPATAELQPARPLLETITVSTSRYHLSRDVSNSRFYLDQRSVQNLPDLGEDPVRAAQRLPGVASGVFSASSHIRGGEKNETGIFLNGHRLLDPFHVRDFQSVFSSVDNRAINGIEVYTGGFPVLYGDGLSGLVLIDALNPDEPTRTELGVSVYNSSILSGGMSESGNAQWLVSARRGNLDLVLDDQFGDPSYHDVFGQVSVNLSPQTQLSLNVLHAKDNALVVLENDIEELEQSNSDTENTQVWLRLDSQWTDELQSTTLMSFASLDNRRVASTEDVESYVSFVDDRRQVREFVFRQDWSWDASDRHRVLWGLQFQRGEAEFDYSGQATYFEFAALIAGTEETQFRSVRAQPDVDSFSLYWSDKWRIGERTILDWGLRWDTQTFTTGTSGSQVSPRISMLHAIGPRTEVRLSWGRFHQSQAVGDLQVEDGVDRYWPAQQADHLIAGFEHHFDDRYSLRAEAFRKSLDRLRPRFENLFDPFAVNREFAPDRIRVAPRRAHMSGVELSLRYEPSERFGWWAGYSLSNAEDTVLGGKELRSWDQRHAFLAGFSWSNERWDIGVAASVRSGWPRTPLELVRRVDEDGEAELEPVIGKRNSKRYPAFASLDARVSRRFDVRRGALTVFLEVTNLTNRRNVCCSDFDLEEDANGDDVLDAGEDFWPPLLPAVGFLWEF